MRIVRHKKTGRHYEVLGLAEAQISVPAKDLGLQRVKVEPTRVVLEGDQVTIYRSLETGKLWFRFPEEFEDGRFEDFELPGLTPSPEPAFDAVSPEQERLAIEYAAEIAGPAGGPGSPPDAQRLLEMAEKLYQADDCHDGANPGVVPAVSFMSRVLRLTNEDQGKMLVLLADNLGVRLVPAKITVDEDNAVP